MLDGGVVAIDKFLPMFYATTEKFLHFTFMGSKAIHPAQDITNQSALFGYTLRTIEAERGGRSERNDGFRHISRALLLSDTLFGQLDVEMLHRKAAITDAHAVVNA